MGLVLSPKECSFTMLHTILGAGGAVGIELSKSLDALGLSYRLVQRNATAVTGSSRETLLSADLTIQEEVRRAVAGSTVVYLTVGFKYKLSTWQNCWPKLINDVVEACAENNARLVFFDNIYALSASAMPHITEQSPIAPPSKKGKVRADVDQYIIDQVERGRLKAIIARSPDFFSSYLEKSLLMLMIYNNLKQNKPAQWLINSDLPHSVGYVPEMAKGMVMLGQDPTAFDRVWNLPVANEAPTARQWTALFAEHLGGDDKVNPIPKWMLRGLGLFMPILGEMVEMTYQYDRPYVFDSSAFQKRYNYTPISPAQAVAEVVERAKA